jgi:hypothetical protein
MEYLTVTDASNPYKFYYPAIAIASRKHVV